MTYFVLAQRMHQIELLEVVLPSQPKIGDTVHSITDELVVLDWTILKVFEGSESAKIRNMIDQVGFQATRELYSAEATLPEWVEAFV